MKKLVKTRVKIYPDGSKQLTVYKEPYLRTTGGSGNPGVEKTGSNSEMLSDAEKEVLREQERLKKVWSVKTKIKDYCLSNDFDYFWTMTFESERDNDDLAFEKLSKWLAKMRRKYGKFNYIIIPERHSTGEIHFHGVTGGFGGKVVDSGVRHDGHRVYNCPDWEYGFTTLSRIRDKQKCASYITKYVTKNIDTTVVEKGKKKYWSSHGLKEPVVEYTSVDLGLGHEEDWSSKDGSIKIFSL